MRLIVRNWMRACGGSITVHRFRTLRNEKVGQINRLIVSLDTLTTDPSAFPNDFCTEMTNL